MSSTNEKEATARETQRPTVVVIGAGLIGTLTAYYLTLSNRYNVVCLEKASAPASGTSKANAGAGSEGGVGKVNWSPEVVSWGIRYIQAAAFRRDQINQVLDRMGHLSTNLMSRLLADAAKDLHTVTPNIWVYADKASMDNGRTVLEKTKLARFKQLNPDQCASLITVSRSIFGISGGCLSVESDFTANAREFTQKIAQKCASMGAKFRYNSLVEKVIRDDNGKICGVELQDKTEIPCDRIVVACGPWSNQLTQKWFGMSLPIMPVRGASVQLENVQNAPKIGFSDNASGDIHFQVTPYGKSLRLAGFADVVSPPSDNQVDVDCSSRYRDALVSRLKVVLPKVTWQSESDVWCGLRPITPDRLPIIGPTKHEGVFLNVGHGAVGWTLAAASGYLLAASMLRYDGFNPLGMDKVADTMDVKGELGITRF